MALFGKSRSQAVSASVIGSLAEYGQAVLVSRSGKPIDARFGWDYVGPVIHAMSGPQGDRAIQEMYHAARAAPDQPLVTVGAYNLLYKADAPATDRRFLELRDATLEYMRQMRYSSGHLTRDEADRWIELHGGLGAFDHTVEVAVPAQAEAPLATDLSPGESRLLALTDPLPDGNAFYAERQDDGTYIVFSERQRSDDDPTRQRYDESYLGLFTSMTDLLRAVGQMFGTRPHWADGDLEPYFPRRRA
jgi:hypothetical protein